MKTIRLLFTVSLVLLLFVLTRQGEAKTFSAKPAITPKAAPISKHAYVLDLGGGCSLPEMYLAFGLQGIVNRDQPRLFIYSHHGGCPQADKEFAKFLSDQKGYQFTKVSSLGEAIELFSGMGLIAGMVKYDLGNDWKKNGYYTWVAGTIAGLDGLLPVTPDLLAGNSPNLSGQVEWTEDDMSKGGWAEMFAFPSRGVNGGLRVTGGRRPPSYDSFVGRWVNLDVRKTPKMEVTVSATTGKWGVGIGVASLTQPIRRCIPVIQAQSGTGTFICDLSTDKGFEDAGHVEIRLCPLSADANFTVKSVRFLDANGKVPSVTFQKRDWFKRLKVVNDLTGKWTSEEDAFQWAMTNLFPRCNPGLVHFTLNDWSSILQLDYAIANKAFLFYEHKAAYRDKTPAFDLVMSKLKKPALIQGWGHDETYFIAKLSAFGHRALPPSAPNFSFWQHVALDGPLHFPSARQVPKLERKCYVNFGVASGDALNCIGMLYNGCWLDPARGSVPISWATNPGLVGVAPAFFEYYTKHATPMDTFWAGPSGAGYCSPSVMKPDDLAIYANVVRDSIQKIGIGPAVDFWDVASMQTDIYAPFTRPAKSAPVKLICPITPGGMHAENFWTDDGTPLITTERGSVADQLMPLWASTEAKIDLDNMGADIGGRIVRVGKANEGPFFVTLNIRVMPKDLKAIMDYLPKDRFQVVGMPDFIALAREAGGFTVIPQTGGAGSLEKVGIDVVLHNPDGITGNPGTVQWTLPSGWTSTETWWAHGPVPKGGMLKHTVFIQAPARLARGTVSIAFNDSRITWGPRTIHLETYPEGRTAMEGPHTDGWVAQDGASVAIENGMVKLLPAKPISTDYFYGNIQNGDREHPTLGRLLYPIGSVDFQRRPVLEFDIPENGSNYAFGINEGNSFVWLGSGNWKQRFVINLSEKVKWTGTKSLNIWFNPVTSSGRFVLLRNVRLYYQDPLP